MTSFGEFLDVLLSVVFWRIPILGLKPDELFHTFNHTVMMMPTFSPASTHRLLPLVTCLTLLGTDLAATLTRAILGRVAHGIYKPFTDSSS